MESLSISSHNNHQSRKEITVGAYVAQRLVEMHVKHFFTVPGDFILMLLDELISDRNLQLIGCCNELNAGYAVDGYCRATGGMGVVCVTYMVGSLSLINAIAGAYSDDLPVLVLVGGPNTNDEKEGHIIHHTIGKTDLYQSSKCFQPVVGKSFILKHLQDAPSIIDEAIETCYKMKKPVYLEIACNLTGQMIPAPTRRELKSNIETISSDPIALSGAVEDILEVLNSTNKLVAIAGVKLRSSEAIGEFHLFVHALGCGVAVMPDAKGLFPEAHPQYMGCYWAGISSTHVAEIVESADTIIMAGPVINDYTTTGWTALLNHNKLIVLNDDHVSVYGRIYRGFHLCHLLSSLSMKCPLRDASLVNFRRYRPPSPAPIEPPSNSQLTLSDIKHQIQGILDGSTSLVVDAGDSWFVGQNLTLPPGAKFHVQMQYGSIGWSLCAAFGIGLALANTRKLILLIGDGAFQMTVQELSSIIRHNVEITIFLLNNKGYTIEVQIHDNIYNNIKNWDYSSLIEVFNNNEYGNCRSFKVQTSLELNNAIAETRKMRGPTLIECNLERDDCSVTLLEWGCRVAAANMRP